MHFFLISQARSGFDPYFRDPDMAALLTVLSHFWDILSQFGKIFKFKLLLAWFLLIKLM